MKKNTDIEYVYLLTNPAMPEWVKVGKTNNIKARVRTLSKKTSVPLPFECEAALKVPAESVFNIEHGLHKLLGFTYQKEKEYFRTTKENIINFFKTMESIVPSCVFLTKDELNEETTIEKKRAAATTFELLQIPVGSELVFIDDTSIACKVEDNKNKVSYKGQLYSLSDIAKQLCGYTVSGYQKFMFEDELLIERRLRLHPEL